MPTTIKEDIEIKEKDFEKNKNNLLKNINKLKINYQAFSPITSKLNQITSFLDIQNYNHIIDSKISSLLNELKTKAYNIYQNADGNITKELKSINDKGKTRHSDNDVKNRAKNRLKELENDKKILEDSKKDLDKYFNYIDTLRNDCNTSSSELEKLNNKQSRREVGAGAMLAIGSSVFGAETAGLMGAAYKGIRTITSPVGRENIKNIIREKGWGGIAKSGAAKLTLAAGAYLGSPGIVAAGGLANASINKRAELKKRNSDVLSKLNLITADGPEGAEGVAHGPTVLGVAMNGKSERFKVTPGKTSVNGVEISQGQSKGVIEELKRTNNLLDQNNDLLKSILGINKESLDWQQDEDKEDELKHKKEDKDKSKVEFSPLEKKKKEEEDKKGFFSNLKSSVIGFAHSLLPKSRVGWAKLGGGIAGAGLGAYGGAKLGKGLAHMMGAEEGSTGETIGKYGGMVAGAAGGAWAGSKIAGKIAGSKLFSKIPGASLLGGVVSSAAARADADQKVYVTNANEIGTACKGGGGILDGAMDMFGGKKGKLASKLFKGGFGRSATRLAAKVGGRGFAKTTSNILGKGAGLLAKSGGLLAEGGGLIGKLGPMLGGMAKFAGPVGLALTAGSALYSGFKGWKNAGDIAGLKPGEKATTGQKVGASIAGALSSLSMGFIDPKTIYTFGSKLGPSLSTAMLGPLGLFFRKKEKNADDLHKKEADLMKDKENENKDFFDKLKPDAGAAGGGILGGFFDKLKDTTQAAKQAYSSSREQGGSFFESLGAAKKSGKEVISGKASENRATLLAEMSRSGITDKKEQAMFMGQMRHESGGFAKMSEGKYSAEAVWKLRGSKLAKQGITLAQLKAEEKSQGKEAMWERMYGGRMGNKAPGDGIKYRGRGFVQLTGKSNYAKFGKLIGVDLVNNPDLASDPKIAARIATAYWKDRGLGEKARRGDLEAVTRGIQGGTLHMAERGEAVKKELALLEKGGVPAPPAAVAKPEAKPAGKAKGYTDDSLTITQGPVTPGKHGIIASRTEKMPDGTEKIYPIYGNPALGPTGKQVENQIAKDRAAILAKMKKGGKKQGDKGSEKVVAETKETYSNSEGVKLKKAERSKVAAKDKTPTVINNVTNNNSTSGQAPKIFVSTNDTNSFPGRLARSY